VHDFHNDLGTAHTLAGEPWKTVAYGDLQQAIERCAWQPKNIAFPIE
jgi:hypothetical protein